MKKKAIKTVVFIVSVLALMFCEYKYIILNINPFIGQIDENGGYVEIEFGGRVDEYYVPRINN